MPIFVQRSPLEKQKNYTVKKTHRKQYKIPSRRTRLCRWRWRSPPGQPAWLLLLFAGLVLAQTLNYAAASPGRLRGHKVRVSFFTPAVHIPCWYSTTSPIPPPPAQTPASPALLPRFSCFCFCCFCRAHFRTDVAASVFVGWSRDGSGGGGRICRHKPRGARDRSQQRRQRRGLPSLFLDVAALCSRGGGVARRISSAAYPRQPFLRHEVVYNAVTGADESEKDRQNRQRRKATAAAALPSPTGGFSLGRQERRRRRLRGAQCFDSFRVSSRCEPECMRSGVVVWVGGRRRVSEWD